MRSAVKGAYLNVRINAKSLDDKAFAEGIISEGLQIESKTQKLENDILSIVNSKL